MALTRVIAPKTSIRLILLIMSPVRSVAAARASGRTGASRDVDLPEYDGKVDDAERDLDQEAPAPADLGESA